MDTNSSEPVPEPIRFRAGKKRKAYRQRAQEDDDVVAGTIQSPPTASTSETGDKHSHRDIPGCEEDGDESVATAIKLRNARRGRLGGVAFRTNRPDDDTNSERALVTHDASDATTSEPIIKGVSERFTHQTGRLTDLSDKHMMDYIESRLSNRAGGNRSQNNSSTSTSEPIPQHSVTASNQESGRAVMQGQLMEIDLDEHSAHSESTFQADSTTDGGRRAKKPRLRRDGKPWRPRNRRDSDALKRDQIVDEILRETRRYLVDLYEPAPEQNSGAVGADQDGAADERLAEEFRQQFLEDVAERQLRKKKATNPTARVGAEEVLKGPKLGGSRNARAQMRDLLLKKEKEGKK
ncbi:hypothetical protein FBEOM_441 [Fusarium beomiforme]|uniref:mRNA splicing factor RNA helicase n=1 Tax=Fusarium beomiforme TaxID=44412 RepID=A0A9P5AV94_9HYPO|nr:hypothetical protein FBEOM_441 [Fusarium beomiforme]